MAQYVIPIGNTFTTKLTISDVEGNAVNLTDATVILTMYDRNGSVYHTETVTTHTTPLSGVTTITIQDEESDPFKIGCYAYNVKANLSGGTDWTVEEGYIEVRP